MPGNQWSKIGKNKAPSYDGMTDIALLEHSIRNDLNKRALRVQGVLKPLKVVIENLPEDHFEELDAVNNPEDPDAGSRKLPFSREIYIDQDDFMEEAPKKFFRLKPEGEVRLRYAYILKCEKVIKDDFNTGLALSVISTNNRTPL